MVSLPLQQARLVTAQELADLPDDGSRHELVEGVLRTMTPAGGLHGKVGARLLVRLGAFVEAHGLGQVFAAETGFVIRRDPDTVRAPDVAFVRSDRASQASTPSFPALVPDLVAEVVNPSDRAVAVGEKALAWLDAGVRLVWVVDPQNRTVTVHRPGGVSVLRGDDVLSGEDVVPEFTAPLPGIWG